MVAQLTSRETSAASILDPRPRPRRPDPATWAVVPASAALAAVVVVRHLGTKPLWRDEAITMSVATRPVTGVLWVLPHHDANAGLYYLLLHGWLGLGTAGPAWARGMSALAFVATAAMASWAVGKWLGWPAGAAGGLLVATNPFLVYYGQEARPYALAACLAVLSVVALFWRADRPAPRAYVVATVSLVYVDLFAITFVLGMALAVIAVHRLRAEPLPPILIRCWGVIGAVSAPLMLVMVMGQRGQISWLSRPDFTVLRQTVSAMSSGWIGLVVVVALAGAAVSTAVARSSASKRDQMLVAALVVAFVGPPLGLWTISQVMPSFIDRYVICSAIAMIGLAAAGFEAVRRRVPMVVALALLAVLVTLGSRHIAQLEAGPFKVDNAAGAWSFITAQSQPGDAMGYAGGGLRIVMDAARPRSRGAPPVPVDIALTSGGEAFRQHDLYAREVSATDLSPRLAGVARLWLVTDPRDNRYPSDGPFGPLRPMVTAAFSARASGSFGAIDVTLYVRNR